jgi:SAM-dependent methyltransferase
VPKKANPEGGNVSVADRICALMQHLNITTAHFAASAPMELAAFLSANPDAVSSLTLLNASRFPLDVLPSISDRLLMFSGVEFADYPAAVWTDMAADHAEQIIGAMLEFLVDQDQGRPATKFSGEQREGVIAGITFDITGEGPALFLFPAQLAPSQWDPVFGSLAEKFAVIRVGGPHLGMVAVLEDRGGDQTSIRALRGMLDDAQVRPTNRLLEVGCGSGVISRWLAREKVCATPLTAIDLNPFLLREAGALAEAEGLGNAIEFETGNAEELPYPDDTFDAVLSVTVIEECDADRAIGEMVRVLRPGGRAMIKVRACDMNVLWNLPVEAEIKVKAEAPIRQVAATGCADASLMQRLKSAGLERVIAYPTFFGGEAHQDYFEPITLARLDDQEQAAWKAAKAVALADGTFYMMHPAHCAVGTKPR